jgi:hypothetical protein
MTLFGEVRRRILYLVALTSDNANGEAAPPDLKGFQSA